MVNSRTLYKWRGLIEREGLFQILTQRGLLEKGLNREGGLNRAFTVQAKGLILVQISIPWVPLSSGTHGKLGKTLKLVLHFYTLASLLGLMPWTIRVSRIFQVTFNLSDFHFFRNW